MTALWIAIRSFLALPALTPVLWMSSGAAITLMISTISNPALETDATPPPPTSEVRKEEQKPAEDKVSNIAEQAQP